MYQNKWSKIIAIILAVSIPISIFIGELELFQRMGNKPQMLIALYGQVGWIFSFAVFLYLIFPSWKLYKKTQNKNFYYFTIIFGLKTFLNISKRVISYTLYSKFLITTDNFFIVFIRYLFQIIDNTITYIAIPLLFFIVIKNFVRNESKK